MAGGRKLSYSWPIMRPILGFFFKMYLWLHERIHERVFHSLAIRYFDGVHPKNIFHYRSEFFLNHARAGDLVIDVACGTGKILEEMAPKIKGGLGLDYDEKNLLICRRRRGEGRLQFRQADILEFDYAALQAEFPYGKAVFSHILEHVADVPTLLKKVNAAELLICVPSQENWYRQTLKHMGLNYFTDATHFREYTRAMLQEELARAGYRVSEIGFNAEAEIVCRAVKA